MVLSSYRHVSKLVNTKQWEVYVNSHMFLRMVQQCDLWKCTIKMSQARGGHSSVKHAVGSRHVQTLR
jgi:hypothetical protein